MGEIGIPRREFLYDIRFWEVRRIVRGYRNRDRLKHQLMAECAFAAMFSNRDPKGKRPRDIFPSLFQDDDDATDAAPIDDKEVARLRQMMREENARMKEGK